MLGACKDDTSNVSGLVISKETNFLIGEIVEGPGDNIYCFGMNRARDSFLVRVYSRQLDFIKELNLNRRSEFHGRLSVDLVGANFFVTDIYKEGISSKVVVHKTNEVFDVLGSEILVDQNTPLNNTIGDIYSISGLSNGNYLVVWDSSVRNTSGYLSHSFRLTTLSPELNYISSHELKRIGGSGSWSPTSIRAVVLEDGSIFYCYNVFVDNGAALGVGLLNADGTLRYQKELEKDAYFSGVIGVSRAGSQVLINRYVNQNELQLYILINPQNGEFLRESQAALGFSNNGWLGPNPLPKELGSNSGHILNNWEKILLEYHTVDVNGNIIAKFTLNLPAFPWFESYRQLHTKAGTIILGVSVDDRESLDFILQEVSQQGTILQGG